MKMENDGTDGGVQGGGWGGGVGPPPQWCRVVKRSPELLCFLHITAPINNLDQAIDTPADESSTESAHTSDVLEANTTSQTKPTVPPAEL